MHKVFNALLSAILVSGTFFTSIAKAEPTSSPVLITYLRPYGGANFVLLGTNNAAGSLCSQSYYSIDLSTNGGKAMYAAALTAVAGSKRIQIEIAGCGNGPAASNPLQSIYILP